MCVCVSAYVLVCVCVCASRIFARVYACMRVCAYVCVYVRVYTRLCVGEGGGAPHTIVRHGLARRTPAVSANVSCGKSNYNSVV